MAIKRVRDDRVGDATQRARFLREARAVARLDHPCIVRVYDVLERDDSNYLVVRQRVAADRHAVDEGAASASRVAQLVGVTATVDRAMPARHRRFEDLEIVGLLTADGEDLVLQGVTAAPSGPSTTTSLGCTLNLRAASPPVSYFFAFNWRTNAVCSAVANPSPRASRTPRQASNAYWSGQQV